jgi:hypothetical protein
MVRLFIKYFLFYSSLFARKYDPATNKREIHISVKNILGLINKDTKPVVATTLA